MDTNRAVVALSALAQESRLNVFRRLVELGLEGAYAGELAELLQIPGNTMSFHLKAVSQAGLITSEAQGRYIRYRADVTAMQDLMGFLSDHCCGGDPSKCAPVTKRKRA